MSLIENGAPAQPQAAAAPAPDGATTQTADAAGGKSYGEDHVKQLIRERDEAKAALRAVQAQPAPQPTRKAQPASEVEDLRAELELKDAIADIAPHLTRDQRAVVRDLFKLQRPGPDGLDAWIAKTAGVFGRTPDAAAPAKSEPAQVVNVAAAAPRTGSLGAPATATTENQPTDPHELVARGMWRSLTPEQRQAAMASKISQSSPFAARFANAAKSKR